MSKGRVYLVGAGPGDPGLITVRGRELLGRADVVVYDHLASPRLLAAAPERAERVYVGKQAADHTLSQDQINQLLVDKASAGATVVRLKGGDPYVFGRGGEEALVLHEAGIEFEVVPGITAGVAAAAYAGIPVTHRTLASNLGLVTGHETPDKEGSDLDFSALAAWRGTLVFYMGMRNLPAICRSLIEHGLDPTTPAAVVRWGTTPRQQTVTATVATLAEAASRANIQPPAVTIIGQVVSLRESLRWFDRRPLLGQRIVVTRARTQASDLTATLSELGAEVIEMPTIRIEPPNDPIRLREAAREVDTYDWIVFTSVNGVDGFFGALDEIGGDARWLARSRVCAIGPATAERLAARGIRADAQPKRFIGSEIADTLSAVLSLSGLRILCPRADIAPPELIGSLSERGAVVEEVVAYRTVAEPTANPQVQTLLEADELAWITFTSSSTARNFFSIVPPDKVTCRSVRIASIGPTTSQTLKELGLRVSVEAKTHTIPGLVDAIMENRAKNSDSGE